MICRREALELAAPRPSTRERRRPREGQVSRRCLLHLPAREIETIAVFERIERRAGPADRDGAGGEELTSQG